MYLLVYAFKILQPVIPEIKFHFGKRIELVKYWLG